MQREHRIEIEARDIQIAEVIMYICLQNYVNIKRMGRFGTFQ
jgi:hypothetical protein